MVYTYLAEFIFKKRNRRVYSYNLYFKEMLDLNFNLHKKNERSMNFKIVVCYNLNYIKNFMFLIN